MVIGRGYTDRDLTDDEAREIVREGLGTLAVDGKRVLILIPDGTRTMPMPLMFDLFQELLVPRAAAMDYLVALGTHQPMSDAQLSKLVGQTSGQRAGRPQPCILTTNGATPRTLSLSASFRRTPSARSPAG